MDTVTKRRKILACVLALLYFQTWVGGRISHAHKLRDFTEATFRKAELQNQELVILANKLGDKDFRPTELHKKPISTVKWCVPVLPGIILTDSAYYVGPLWARGGVKIVFFYGFGSTVLVTLSEWRA